MKAVLLLPVKMLQGVLEMLLPASEQEPCTPASITVYTSEGAKKIRRKSAV